MMTQAGRWQRCRRGLPRPAARSRAPPAGLGAAPGWPAASLPAGLGRSLALALRARETRQGGWVDKLGSETD